MAKVAAMESYVELSPSRLVSMLSPQDKATIMSLCMPKGATDSELALYLYRCREMGFDPLSGELVLRKWVGEDGPKLSFITTRDALLRKAAEHPDYMGLNSGVVREGDTFLVDTEKGVVKHTFGAKRGEILAGWAVVYHKTRLPMVAVVDYEEYAAANSRSPVWRSMPSAMIQKVAEVAALKRQFPVGVQVYTMEELSTETETYTPEKVELVIEKDGPASLEAPVQPVQEAQPAKEEDETVQDTQILQEAVPVQETQAEQPETKPVRAEAPEGQSQGQSQDVCKLMGLQTSKSATGVPFAKIFCEKDGKKQVLIAKGEEGLAEAAKLFEGCSFKADTVEEKGFSFISTITIV